ncbi:ABC transporter permease [Paenibacillus tarimensis]|uniref:ABC transporter permease n=1 Tax=Paenibacillus tarimensis TaxID=416012 RepID=UPI001F2AEF48|nr:ABC transporter permease subunit [Paenibacillus tarimensis]MCF2942724.1 ABC transporter permease subunit [Paenibacillus tarimensis]
MRRSRRFAWPLLAAVLPFLFMAACFEIVPLISMLFSSFRAEAGSSLTLEHYLTSLSNPFYTKAIRNSVLIALYSSVIGLAVGMIAANTITRLPETVRDRILMISNMTSNFAGVPLAFAFIILLGNNGLFTLLFDDIGLPVLGEFELYSWTGLVLVYVYFQIPLAILLMYPTYYGIKEQWREASGLLGAGTVQFWRYIGLPLLLPGMLGTFSILFANAMGAYATAYALVGGNYNLLAIRIGSLTAGDVYVRPELGSALAVLLAAAMLLAMWINERMMLKVRRDLAG